MNLLVQEEPHSAERTYPPYNLEEISCRHYRLTMALAGFSARDLSVAQKGSTLVVRGHAKDKGEGRIWLHRGIATRAFERRFLIDTGVDIQRAVFENGMLCIVIKLERDDAMSLQSPGMDMLPDGGKRSQLVFC